MPKRGEHRFQIRLPGAVLPTDCTFPRGAEGIVVFVHGSGSSRRSVRNRQVAAALQQRGFATLLFDLLTEREDEDHDLRFDIPHLTGRLLAVTRWIWHESDLPGLPLGYFGASTGAAAALNAAAELGSSVSAIVSRGGRPDLARDSLARVRSPTLLIVGGSDTDVVGVNVEACARLACVKRLAVIPGATHLFEEGGALDEVARIAGDWFGRYCRDATPHLVEPVSTGAPES